MSVPPSSYNKLKAIVLKHKVWYGYIAASRKKAILLSNLIEIYNEEKTCEYRGEVYSVRDNGAIMRYPKEGKKPRRNDNKWTFGSYDKSHGYTKIGNEAVHRIVATAFLGEAPTKSHVVDHIDTNRQNNRPNNLRWVTRLENIVLNEITRKKLELCCGCSIEDILSDMSRLRHIPLTSNFEWMKAVSQEEADKSLTTWRNWVNEVGERIEHDKQVSQSFEYKRPKKLSESFEYRNPFSPMVYPLEPQGDNMSLDAYYNNLNINEEFCYKDYTFGRVSFSILDYCINEETNTLSVATSSAGGVKSLYLTSITFNNNEFLYDTTSFFSMEGLEKYMTLARGEEWTGGEVFDDLVM